MTQLIGEAKALSFYDCGIFRFKRCVILNVA
jgi:hypothetical protein